MNPAEILPGRRILCLESCVSTHDVARKLAEEGAEHGTAVFAEEQTGGRGRHGRTWTAPAGRCLLVSVILRTPLRAEWTPLVTAAAALAAGDAARAAGLETSIKFPNDVYAGGRKLAGVLVESRFVSGRPELFLAGIGLNVNVARDEFPPELRETATSLSAELGREVSRTVAARALLEGLDRWARSMQAGPAEIAAAWRERSGILGRDVTVETAGRTLQGRVEDVDVLEGVELRLQGGDRVRIRGEHVERLRPIG